MAATLIDMQLRRHARPTECQKQFDAVLRRYPVVARVHEEGRAGFLFFSQRRSVLLALGIR